MRLDVPNAVGPPTRTTLLVRVRDWGNEQAWADFVALYTPLIFGYVRRRGLQEADAADVAQDVMRAVASAMRKFEYDPGRGTFRSWLFTVTRSKLNNFLKSRQRHPEGGGRSTMQRFLEAQPSPEQDHDWDEEYHQRLFEWGCERVRGEFQDSTWRAFWRTVVEDRSCKEVAADLNLSVGAVYVARSRVLARLKAALEDLGEAPPALTDVNPAPAIAQARNGEPDEKP